MPSEAERLTQVAMHNAEQFRKSLCDLNEYMEARLHRMTADMRGQDEGMIVKRIINQVDKAFDGLSGFAVIEAEVVTGGL